MVPGLLKAMLTVGVPVPAGLREVAALLNVPAGEKVNVRAASDWASKTAPAWLLNAAPLSSRNCPVPAQVVGPDLLTVTPLRTLAAAPLRFSGPLRLKAVLDGAPLRVPAAQLTAAPAAVASMARPPEPGNPFGMFSDAPAPSTVAPAPAWVPPVQVMAPVTVRLAAPVSVPPTRLSVGTLTGALTVAVPPLTCTGPA